MNTVTITINETNIKITALDSAGMGMIARWFDFYALTDEEILNRAMSFPNNLSIEPVK